MAVLSERALNARTLSLLGYALAAAAALTLAGAWFFELVLGLEPCPLCLDQRIPYYAAVPLGIAAGLLASHARLESFTRLALLLIGTAMLVGAGYGIYHSGIEWGFWEGPASCAAAADRTAVGDILSSLKTTVRVVPCNEAAWRFLGLSLAGYNVLIAVALAAAALWAARLRITRGA